MCCSCKSEEMSVEDIDGFCEECGQDTVEGDSFYGCHYSPTECDKCNWSPCDGSC